MLHEHFWPDTGWNQPEAAERDVIHACAVGLGFFPFLKVHRSGKWCEHNKLRKGYACTLRQVEKSAGLASRELALIKPPADAAEVHGLLQNAFQMAARAIEIRMKAIGTNDMSLAWQASSAAAGALLMLDRARDDIQRLTSPPIK